MTTDEAWMRISDEVVWNDQVWVQALGRTTVEDDLLEALSIVLKQHQEDKA